MASSVNILSFLNSTPEQVEDTLLNETIEYHQKVSEEAKISEKEVNKFKVYEDHKQLSLWLMELRTYREAREKIITEVKELEKHVPLDYHYMNKVVRIIESLLPKEYISPEKQDEFADTILSLWMNRLLDDEEYIALRERLENYSPTDDEVIEPTELDRKLLKGPLDNI